jgi:signal transduction histidine kinase
MLEGLQSGRDKITDTSFETLANHAKRSLKLAEQFLQVARAEQIDKTEFIDCEINNIIENSIDEVAAYATSKQIFIQFDFEEEIWIQVHAELLERAITNLLNNAIKYSNNTSEITISLNKSPSTITISISDQGVGIEEENRMLIFQPFHRLPNQATKNKGSGLGLYFVKTVIEKHQGSISVHPPENGNGSTFQIMLPLNKVEAE